MLNLPKATEVSKQLPKKAIYSKFSMNTAAKEKFDADISKLAIVNEVSKVTSTPAAGKEVASFYVLLVTLKRKEYNETTIAQLSKLINQNMLFILEFNGEAQLAVFRSKVIMTKWQPIETLSVTLKGLNLDDVWAEIVHQIVEDEFETWNEELTLDENVSELTRQENIKKQIATLEKRAKAEKQPKKKFEIVQEIKKLEEMK